jgi:beta-N-acetylhexosaminidase
MNLAPLSDVMSNPSNPIIGTRSCGTTPNMVITHARALLNGFHRAGITTSLKHFPGHGDTSVDSHQALPIVNKTYGELKTCELVPFYALAPETDSIMTAHIMVPTLDPLHCATLSPTILNMLRTEAPFQGIIISDSLVMAGITNNYPNLSEAAIQAFNSGCNILLLGGKQLVGSTQTELSYSKIASIHQALVDAVLTHRISQQRLDESVTKILTLKQNYPLANNTPTPDYHAHQKLSYTVAEKALAALANTPQTLPNRVFETLNNQLHHNRGVP